MKCKLILHKDITKENNTEILHLPIHNILHLDMKYIFIFYTLSLFFSKDGE